MTRVTVVSAFHNRADRVRTSVESLLAQTHSDLEIIIADDGSTDETYAVLQGFSDPRLTVFTQPNAGFVRTMNRLVAMAGGAYVAVHGSGDVSHPDRIARQAELLDADPRIGLVGCGVTSGGRAIAQGVESGGRRDLLAAAMQAKTPFTHGEMMYRKSLFEQVGGYREAFTFAQDRDLWLRMGERADFAIVPDMLYERRLLPDGVSRSADKVVLQKKLAAFALFCARERQAGRPDPLDTYGAAGFLLAGRSESAARQLLRYGLGFARRGDIDGALTVISAAGRESGGLTRLLARGLANRPVLRCVNGLLSSEHASRTGRQ